MLVDDVVITIKAGNGGNGAATFLRNAGNPRGGPDGGNGGNGGNIYFQGVSDITALQEFRFKKKLQAEHGINGARKNLYGRNGKDLYVFVPFGTQVIDTKTGESFEITDMTTQVLLAKGGTGGRGNNEFKSATNQAPTYAEKGGAGDEKQIHLTLRLIADIGFIGLPNAGKSSLLQSLTNARPKIGNYPFTTLEPNLGVMPIRHASKGDESIVLADIPGLIEGASHGKGLGTAFLRHVEKTKLLIHCIDATSENPYASYQIVRKEFEQYDTALLEKPEIILLTKIDLIPEPERKEKEKLLKKTKRKVYTVSIYDEENIEKLKTILMDFV